jgi:hypothetical protein
MSVTQAHFLSYSLHVLPESHILRFDLCQPVIEQFSLLVGGDKVGGGVVAISVRRSVFIGNFLITNVRIVD